MCSIHFVRADARPAFASNIVIVANAVNLGLDFLFMGAFKMGIAGSSIATVTGYAVGFVMMSTHFIMKKSTLHFDFSILRNPVQFFKFLGKMVTIGLSGALGTMLITVKMLFFKHNYSEHRRKCGYGFIFGMLVKPNFYVNVHHGCKSDNDSDYRSLSW